MDTKEDASVGSGKTTALKVKCPNPLLLTGGGCSSEAAPGTQGLTPAIIIQNAPTDDRTWECAWVNINPVKLDVKLLMVTGVCVEVPGQ